MHRDGPQCAVVSGGQEEVRLAAVSESQMELPPTVVIGAREDVESQLVHDQADKVNDSLVNPLDDGVGT